MSESSFTSSCESDTFDNIVEFSNDFTPMINAPKFSEDLAFVLNSAIKFSDDSVSNNVFPAHILIYFDNSTAHDVLSVHNIDSDKIVNQNFEIEEIFDDNECIHMSDNDSGTLSSEDEEEKVFYQDTNRDDDSINEFISAFSNFNKEHLCESSIAIQPMHEGSPLTVLDGLIEHFSVFTNSLGVSKEAFSSYLKLVHYSCQPFRSNLLFEYKSARKLIGLFSISTIVFDICEKYCIAYRRKYKSCLFCPTCKLHRYVSTEELGRLPEKSSSRQVARHRFIYLPIGPRLKKIYGNLSLREIIQLYGSALHSTSNTVHVHDIHDSSIWKSEYASNGFFKGDFHNIFLALDVDGVKPFRSIWAIYSMTPIMMTMLNLSRSIRNLFEKIMLLGIIPGKGRSTPKPDCYLEIVVDELLALNNVQMLSIFDDAPIDVKVKILLCILDYPDMSQNF